MLSNAWRRPYEVAPALAWAGVVGWMLFTTASLRSDAIAVTIALSSAGVSVLYLARTYIIVRNRYALLGKGICVVEPEYVKKKMLARPDCIWFGWGFEWKREHAQRLYDLEKIGWESVLPSGWLRGRHRPPKKGTAKLHGIEPCERDVYVPVESLEGHMFVPATTGAIKTRLLALLVLQHILREPKEAVIVIDPKGDTELIDIMRWACKVAGREEDFLFFHPAFSSRSVRIDLLKNVTTLSELASRMATLIDTSGEGEAFRAYAWQSVNHVVQALFKIGDKPDLSTLRRHLEGGPDVLVARVIRVHLEELGINTSEVLESYRSRDVKLKGRIDTTPFETRALVHYYKDKIQSEHYSREVDGVLSMYEHDTQHLGKMLTALLPILSMLTSGELADMLSPDYESQDDSRPIVDLSNITHTGKVIYIGLHSLADKMVSEKIGSLVLSDLAAVLGNRYVNQQSRPRINLFLDEANASVNRQFVEILNKGRAAGSMVYFFTQGVSDFVAKFGDKHMAWTLLLNSNNILIGRSNDPETKAYIESQVPNTIIHTVQTQQMTNAVTGQRDITHFHATYGERFNEIQELLIPLPVFSAVPDMEYYAVFAGNRIEKGRIPIVAMDTGEAEQRLLEEVGDALVEDGYRAFEGGTGLGEEEVA